MEAETKNETKMIAKFMGLKLREYGTLFYVCDEDAYVDLMEAIPYWPHKNWNDLMPVVEKIEKDTKFKVEIESIYCDVTDKYTSFEGREGTKLSSTYKAIVEFIKWYTSQKGE